MSEEYKYVHEKKKHPKPTKTQEDLNAEKGIFNFTEINGFKLKQVEWTVPDQQTRKRRRSGFDKVRKAFLEELGTNHVEELVALGLTPAQIKQVKAGKNPNGYNVHHKHPIHGGGHNVFENLILMPIKPHDELHHKVMDPQVKNMQSGDSKMVWIPWSDDMVYHDPEKAMFNTKFVSFDQVKEDCAKLNSSEDGKKKEASIIPIGDTKTGFRTNAAILAKKSRSR
ncbi:MAG: HNH endonuclease [Alphaproteobacteria bacterium]|nr:HNH endonuclease [Alphaproteobacteria bacterium]